MDVYIGDRVTFRKRGLPDHKIHRGGAPVDVEASPEVQAEQEQAHREHIARTQGSNVVVEAPNVTTWQQYFGDLKGVIDTVDPINGEVRVSGLDKDQRAFVVWIDPKHLDVYDPAPVERG